MRRGSLAPLLNAEPVIQVHAFAAMAAFALGIVQLTASNLLEIRIHC
jgi:uncharacterized membrane protein